ncbi:MAG: peptidase MA family metallohydrolase [Dehalococcoidia bacterium]|nr:peptidase MA family metallohydrolase [Dehalococcoidia bacterium]
MKRVLLSIAIALAVVTAAPLPGARAMPTGRAQSGVVVDSTNAENDFPNGVNFSLSFHSDVDLSKLKVTFRYTIPPEGASVYEEPECDGGTKVQCTYNLKSGPQLFLVPGANVNYYWQVDDDAGNSVKTQPATFIYDDTRFDWKSMTEGNLTVFYYAGDESDVRSLLQTGIEGLQRMEQLLNTQVGFPVKVFLYDSAEDMRPAAMSSSESPERGVITLGEVFFSDTAVVAHDVRPQDIMRHELAHIVVRQAVKGPFGNLPAWLDEGTAMYAQSDLLSNEERALESAIESDEVLSLRAMSSASLAHTSVNVSLFYGQSWSVISFLVDQYGTERFADLFATFKAGSTVDKALEQVYGFEQDGLENAWRESVGLPARKSTGQQGQTTPLPQLTPFEGNGGGSGEQEAGSGGGFAVGAAALLAALAVLVVAAVAMTAVRRRR